MPASMNFNRYAVAWLDLFDYLCENPTTPLEVKCADERKAKGMRLEFYKAREAIFRSEQDFKEKDPVGYNQMGHGALDGREIRVIGDTVVFGCKDDNTVARALRAALALVQTKKDDKGE